MEHKRKQKKAEERPKEASPGCKEIQTENKEKLRSDGSAEAFYQTEEVTEDNFDDLREK